MAAVYVYSLLHCSYIFIRDCFIKENASLISELKHMNQSTMIKYCNILWKISWGCTDKILYCSGRSINYKEEESLSKQRVQFKQLFVEERSYNFNLEIAF